MVARSQAEGMIFAAEGMIFAIDAIQTPSKAMNRELDPAQRNSREEAIGIGPSIRRDCESAASLLRIRRSPPIPIDSKMAA